MNKIQEKKKEILDWYCEHICGGAHNPKTSCIYGHVGCQPMQQLPAMLNSLVAEVVESAPIGCELLKEDGRFCESPDMEIWKRKMKENKQ